MLQFQFVKQEILRNYDVNINVNTLSELIILFTVLFSFCRRNHVIQTHN